MYAYIYYIYIYIYIYTHISICIHTPDSDRKIPDHRISDHWISVWGGWVASQDVGNMKKYRDALEGRIDIVRLLKITEGAKEQHGERLEQANVSKLVVKQ